MGDFYIFFVEGSEYGESAGELKLAEFAVADGSEVGFAGDAITHGTARAAAGVGVCMVCSLRDLVE